MIIGIDFDNVLFPTTEMAINFYNMTFHTNLSMSNIKTYSFHECLDNNIADKIISFFNEKVLYDHLKPIDKSIQVVKTLVDMGHRVVIATATDSKNLCWKEELIEKFFPFIPKNNVIKIHQKELLKLDVLIDDCLDHLTSNITERICFDYPWNQNKNKDFVYDIYRIHSWDEVLNIIHDIERKNKEWETK